MNMQQSLQWHMAVFQNTSFC